jgi:hypothetical protein
MRVATSHRYVMMCVAGPHAEENEWCWARIEDTSTTKSGRRIMVSARIEQIDKNKLEDFPEFASRVQNTGQWLSPARAVTNKRLLFLNVSDSPTILEICSVNFQARCSADDPKMRRTSVKPRELVILMIGKLQRQTLSLRSIPTVPAVIGLLEPGIPTTREYTSDSSVRFGDVDE